MGGGDREGSCAAVGSHLTRRRNRSKPWRNDCCGGCSTEEDNAIRRHRGVDACQAAARRGHVSAEAYEPDGEGDGGGASVASGCGASGREFGNTAGVE